MIHVVTRVPFWFAFVVGLMALGVAVAVMKAILAVLMILGAFLIIAFVVAAFMAHGQTPNQVDAHEQMQEEGRRVRESERREVEAKALAQVESQRDTRRKQLAKEGFAGYEQFKD